MNIFELSVNIFEEFIAIMFLSLFFGFKYKGFKRYLGMLAGIFSGFMLISYLNLSYFYEGLLGIFLVSVYFIYCVIFLKGNNYSKLFMSGFIDCLIQVISLISVLLIYMFTDKHYAEILEFSVFRIFYVLATKVVLIICCLLILKFKPDKLVLPKNKFIPIIIIILNEFSLNIVAHMLIKTTVLDADAVLGVLSMIIMSMFSYYIFMQLSHAAQLQIDYNTLNQKYDLDKAHIRDTEDLYSKMCGIRHDLTNHFTTIKALLESSPVEAKEYIEALLKNQFENSKSIASTDNICFDAIVNTKLAVCEREGITVHTQVRNGILDKLASDEIGILFGNLFDNAIEASKNSCKKLIELDVREHNGCLSIVMTNSVDKSVLEENPNLETTKSDKELHGLGTSNIKRIVNKYGGFINYFEENGKFGCQILV